MNSAVVKEQRGSYWTDMATIRFEKNTGEVKVFVQSGDGSGYLPDDSEAQDIKRALLTAEWPRHEKPLSILNAPDMISECKEENLFKFLDREGRIIMLQTRTEKDGEKRYVPWTYWDDGQWRALNPEGSLPLYNQHLLNNDAHTVFIHEGAKAARAVQEMTHGKLQQDKERLAEHPWGRELSGAIHLGWIGGALNPWKTDWSVLHDNGVRRVYIVADNDAPGRKAVPSISQQIRIPTFMVQFTDEFPAAFDLADPFPAKLFGKINGGSRIYQGPSFRQCLHPATWATDVIPPAGGRGRPGHVLRESFKDLWAYVEELDLYVCQEMPEFMRNEPILNKMLAPFSHVQDTCRLINKNYAGRNVRVCYKPGEKELKVTFQNSSAINLHTPGSVRSVEGNPQPWLEFMSYMFVNVKERDSVLRWCATLIARPDVRMRYGLLLISESQGVGKNTLGSTILAPLVGLHNTSFPSETDVIGAFNDWVANKRLAIISEIYSGSSWRAYHRLKEIVTEENVQVNIKYQRPFTIENWVHVIAMSNSMRALKMENDDRRWLYPELTELPWPREKFSELHNWLNNGGQGIIKHWAENYGEYVMPGERAPMTERKREMIEGSRSEAQAEAAAVAEVLNELEVPAAVLIKDVVGWCRGQAQGRVFDSDYELRRAMKDGGAVSYEQRIKIHGKLQYVMMNKMMADIVKREEDDTAKRSVIREGVRLISSFMEHQI